MKPTSTHHQWAKDDSMIKLKTILTELFDSKPFKLDSKKPKVVKGGIFGPEKYEYTFKSDVSGIEYVVLFTRNAGTWNDEGGTFNNVEIGFNTKERNDAGKGTQYLTNANEIGRILATVSEATENFYENAGFKGQIAKFYFTGDTKAGESFLLGGARLRIYKAFVQKTLPPKWYMHEHGTTLYVVPPDSPHWREEKNPNA